VSGSEWSKGWPSAPVIMIHLDSSFKLTSCLLVQGDLLVEIIIFFFFLHLGGKFFEFSRQKDFETLRWLEETSII
jgi:hypothetical protein